MSSALARDARSAHEVWTKSWPRKEEFKKTSDLDSVVVPQEAHQSLLQNKHLLHMLESKSQPGSCKALSLALEYVTGTTRILTVLS